MGSVEWNPALWHRLATSAFAAIERAHENADHLLPVLLRGSGTKSLHRSRLPGRISAKTVQPALNGLRVPGSVLAARSTGERPAAGPSSDVCSIAQSVVPQATNIMQRNQLSVRRNYEPRRH